MVERGRGLAATLVIAAIYFLLARLGLQFATINHNASPVWPASGFAIGVTIVWGGRAWLGILIGAFAANLLQGSPAATAFAIGVGNLLEAVAGAAIYRLIKKSEMRHGPLVEAFAVCGASTWGSLVSPSIGVTVLAATGAIPMTTFRSAWITWWSGDVIGGLFVIPLVQMAHGFWTRAEGRSERAAWSGKLLQFVGGVALASLLVVTSDGTWYLCGAMIVVLAMSSGARGSDPALAAFAVATAGIGGIALGYGPFRAGSVNDNLLNLQLFLSSIAVTVLFLRAFMRLGPIRAPGLVLVAGCGLGGVTTYQFVQRAELADQQRIDRIVGENSLRIEERLESYRQAVDAGAAFFGTMNAFAPTESDRSWQLFVAGLGLPERFSAMAGLGIADTDAQGRLIVRRFTPETVASPKAGSELSAVAGLRFDKRVGDGPGSLVFAPLDPALFFKSIPYFAMEEMRFSIDGDVVPTDAAPVRASVVEVAGKRYQLSWYRTPGFASSHDTTIAWVASAISLVALALAAFVANLQAVRIRAEDVAHSMAKMSTLGEMAGSIAHEINNPLTVIGVTAAQLQRDVETGHFDREAMAKKLERIDRTVKRTTAIVQGLRVFSRSADTVRKEPVQMQDVVSHVVDLCQDRFRHHEVSLEVVGRLDFEVHASIVQIEQVLMNLLANAFDAVHAGPTRWVRLEVEALDREVRVIVLDGGTRIPPAVADRMMEPFFTTKELGKGTGLGLSISQGILASHGGQLFYDGTRDHTCFVMVLPRLAARKAA